MMIVWNYKIRS